MAVAVRADVPQGKFIDTIDANDPDYVRQILRPPNIKEDVKLMQERSRVSLILRSPVFRKELEKIVASQMKSGCLNANLVALKQIIDYLTPQTRLGSSTFTRSATMPVVPINDLRSVHHASYVKGERLVRCKVASVYRLIDIFGWNTGINNHITARVTKDADEFLINPTGLLYNELTASSLVKIDLKGKILEPGTAALGFDRQGWILHAAVHAARPDVRCIIHLSTPAAVAVSCSKSGLLPLSQEAMIVGEVAVYDPSSMTNRDTQNGEMDPAARRERRFSEEYEKLTQIFSSHSSDCMLLLVRSHGLLAMGQSVEEALFIAVTAMVASEAQLRLAGINLDDLILPNKEAQDIANNVGRNPAAVQLRLGETAGSSGWKRGELEFEALMRRLDATGYRTGYVYRLGQVRQPQTAASTLQRQPRDTLDSDAGSDVVSLAAMSPKDAAAYVRRTASLGRGLRGLKDVEIPPSASSFATAYYVDDETRALTAAEIKAKTLSLSRTHWLNTPNTYLRQDIEEIGTSNPKKIPHWTEDMDETKPRTGGVAVPIVDPNQFAPQGSNPNEFRINQKRVKEKYYKDIKSAGPKSRILEGIDSDEDTDFSDGAVSPKIVSPRGTLLRIDPSNPPTVEPGHVVVVGAASKGIIQRNQRHNAGVYQSIYSPNPFDRMTDEDLNRYKENVDRKAKGLPSLEEEEARARIEEARQAAEAARQAMEAAAARQAYEQKLSSLDSANYIAHTNCGSTLADLNTSILCSSTASDKLMNNPNSELGSLTKFDPDCNTFRSFSLDTFSSSALRLPSTAREPMSNEVSNISNRSYVRRRSALRYWHGSHLTTKRSTLASIAPLPTDETDLTSNQSGTFTSSLRRHQTFTASTTTNTCNSNNALPTLDLRTSSSRFSLVPETAVGSTSYISDWMRSVSELVEQNRPGLDVSRAVIIKSDTSGAEASHDDTEKETKKAADESIEKKKKRRFKMPSFARKSKPKEKK